jgi:hypothetical protein
MDWRFLEGWWERLRAGRRETVLHEQEAALARARRDRDADQKRKREDREADDRFTLAMFSEEHRRQLHLLLNDIDDAAKAAQLAYQRAVRDEEAAQTALDEARRDALILPDGRRAYFNASGRLFLEDGGEITDALELDAARRARNLKPDATTYEDYSKKVRNFDDSNGCVQQIGETLQRLRELNERLEARTATPDELATARKEFDEITRSMSPDMREDYDRLRAAGGSDLPLNDPASGALTILTTDFTRASQQFSAQNSQPDADPAATSAPAYKNAPEF